MLSKTLKPLIRWEGDFRSLFFRLTIPIALQNLISSSLHIVDNIMVGGVGQAQYAGVIQANRLTFITQLFIFGVVSGAGIFAAQFWGKRDIKGMRCVQGLALRLACGVAVLFSLILLVFQKQVLRLFLPEGESFEYARQYLRIISPFYFLIAIEQVFAMMLKSSERARIPMVAAVCSLVTNSILNYVLIYGKLGLPALGVRGAAIATVVAGFLSMSINVGYSYYKKLVPAARLSEWRLPESAFLRRFGRTILPVVLNEGLWSTGTTLYSMVYGQMGDEVVAAMGVAGTVDQLVFILGYGIMNAAAIIVGRSIGAGRKEEAFLYGKRMIFAGSVAMMAMGVVLLAVRNLAVLPFAISPAAKEMALQVMFISAFFLWVRAFNGVNVVGVLRAGGDTMFSMLLDACSIWLVGAPLVALTGLVLGWPLPAVYLVTQLEECLKVVIGLPRFLSKKWINDLVEEGVPDAV